MYPRYFTYPLVEGTWTHGTGIWFLPCVNAFMFTQCATISKCLPAETASIWTLTSVDTCMNLLTTAWPKGLATFSTWKLTCWRFFVVAVTMVYKSTSIREFQTTFITRYCFISMRNHVPVNRTYRAFVNGSVQYFRSILIFLTQDIIWRNHRGQASWTSPFVWPFGVYTICQPH